MNRRELIWNLGAGTALAAANPLRALAVNPVPQRASIVIEDMLENCAELQAGQEVLLIAHIDGLNGSDNMVESPVIDWVHAAIERRGANSSVLWIDEQQDSIEDWRMPPIVEAAMRASDLVIIHSFHIELEEFGAIQDVLRDYQVPLVRNFCTTAALMTSDWAYTPYEIVSEIRYQTADAFTIGGSWTLENENGTSLEGSIGRYRPLGASEDAPTYALYRQDTFYRPFPEWVIPPMRQDNVNGVIVLDRALSWWTRWIGISPFFEDEVRLEVRDGVITSITGGREAESIKAFIDREIVPVAGERAWMFTRMHPGVHPNARITETQCPNILHRRLIDHSHMSNIHMHFGDLLEPLPEYNNIGIHLTGDLQNSTWAVDGKAVIDQGYNMMLQHPRVLEVAARYPGRPGLDPLPWRG